MWLSSNKHRAAARGETNVPRHQDEWNDAIAAILKHLQLHWQLRWRWSAGNKSNGQENDSLSWESSGEKKYLSVLRFGKQGEGHEWKTTHRKQDGGRKVDRHRKNKNPGKTKLSHRDKVATKELKTKCKVQINEHTGTKTRQTHTNEGMRCRWSEAGLKDRWGKEMEKHWKEGKQHRGRNWQATRDRSRHSLCKGV